VQRTSLHDASHMTRDTSGKNALLGREFYYFGAAAPPMPGQLSALMHPSRGHRRFVDRDLVSALENWLRSCFTPGIHGEPFHRKQRHGGRQARVDFERVAKET
jgi:hypothetical protein